MVVIVTVAVCAALDKVTSAGEIEQPMVVTASAGVHVRATLPVKPETDASDSGKFAETPCATVAVVVPPLATVSEKPGEDPTNGFTVNV